MRSVARNASIPQSGGAGTERALVGFRETNKGSNNRRMEMSANPSISFETINSLDLDNVNGGDLGAIVDAGNRTGNAGALLGAGAGAVAGGIAGGVGGTAVFPGPGSAAGAFAGAAGGAGIGGALGGAAGWVGGAATETWRQVMPKWAGGR
jgi:hypothetical protein